MSTTTLAPPITRAVPRVPAQRATRPARPAPVLRTPVPEPREAALAVPPAGGVRLTRRGQVVVVLAGLLAALAFALFAGADSVATEQPGLDAPAELVTVGTGETLWDLAAERTPPGGDVRAMMRRIENINVLETAALEAGQQVMVPAAD